MLQTVDVGVRSMDAYRGVVPDAIMDELSRCAADLRGSRVLHVNATPYGGGVSELLRSLVPLLNDLGLIADWKVISGDAPFFQATKVIHNGLQGAERALTADEEAAYLANAERNARQMQESYDFVVVHDPQPAALLPLRGKDSARWIWRCHIDTSEPNPEVWRFLRPFLTDYDAAVFTMNDFVPPDLPVDVVEAIPPAIDPLSPKNLPLPDSLARQVLDWIGIELNRPLITQVSRFDPWKDPLGVIAAHRLVREEVPNVQLALVGSMALDDPEGWHVYERILDESRSDPLVHVFTNLTGVSNIEVNAFQRLSDIVVQKSTREGFGLVVSEAMWKGTPVVAGKAGGIPLQMADGVGGILVDGVEDCAAAMLRLLQNPDEGRSLAARGRERVREHFLLPRLILNELSLLLNLARERPLERAAVHPANRDPVCNMAIGEDGRAPTVRYEGREYRFCSDDCRRRFLESPQRYIQSP